MYRSQTRFGVKARTIGVLVDWIGDPYQVGLLTGLLDGSAAAGANVLCFVGGQLPGADGGVDARHRIYELAGPTNCDGLVLFSSTYGHHVGPHGVARYCERYRPLPTSSVGVELAGMPSITPDNAAGMRAAVNHLIRDHQRRRVAFIRGPLANEEAETRFAAYRTVLSEHGIAFDEALVALGDFMAESGAAAVAQWVKLYGPRLQKLDAIVASNDAMAIGVLGALDALGLAVPEQLALVGFDDVEESRLTLPPLTTVRQSLEKAGRAALRAVLEWLQNGAPPADERLSTELVVRRSCGCSSVPQVIRPPPTTERTYPFDIALAGRRQDVVDALTRAARGCFGVAGSHWEDRLLNALVADLAGSEQATFARVFHDMLERVLARGTNVEVFEQVVRALRQQTLPLLRTEHTKRERAEDLFHLAHQDIFINIQRRMARDNIKLARGARTMSAVCNALAATFDLEALRQGVLGQLPSLGMTTCFVVLYETHAGSTRARLLVAYAEGKELRCAPGLLFDPAALLPPQWVQSDKRGHSFVVMPLCWKQESLGHVLLELNIEHAFSYGTIAEALSTAVRGALLGGRPSAAP